MTAKTSRKKIYITGGHMTPAIAVIEQIRKDFPDWEIVFIGRKYALEGDTAPSEEYRIISEIGIRYIPLTAGRLQRHVSVWFLLSLIKIPVGFVQSFFLCALERPSVILSFGGYIAVPVVCAAWLLGIPTVTHEQTQTLGLANRVIASMAKRIYVSFPGMFEGKYIHKTMHTGLPIREGIFSSSGKSPFSFNTKLPLLYMTGGSTGAASLNAIFFECIPSLVKRFTIVHQTGKNSYKKALVVRDELPAALRNRYILRSFLDLPELSWVLARSTIVIGRAGANTVGELAALGKVAILIPLPWAASDEQRQNARYLVEAGSAMSLEQAALNPDMLLATINTVMKKYPYHHAKALALTREIPHHAASMIVHDIADIIIQ